MDWGHTLPITPSKLCLHALCKDGAHGAFRHIFIIYCNTFIIRNRCTARPEDLDGEGGRRSHEHTDALLDLLDLKMLWDDYGIVGDIIVSRIVNLETHMLTRTGSHSPLRPTFLVRTFMSFYPWISFIRSLREHSRTIL
jgi:hypothetical protein